MYSLDRAALIDTIEIAENLMQLFKSFISQLNSKVVDCCELKC